MLKINTAGEQTTAVLGGEEGGGGGGALEGQVQRWRYFEQLTRFPGDHAENRAPKVGLRRSITSRSSPGNSGTGLGF